MNDKVKLDTSKGFGFYIDRTLKKISSTYLKLFRENNVDLTIEQWVTLQRIYILGSEASQAEITKYNYRNRATTSRLISGLEKKQLVRKERFDGDKKKFKLVLTEKGLELYTNVLPLVKELRAIGYQNISEEDFNVFMKILEQIWVNYDELEQNRVLSDEDQKST